MNKTDEFNKIIDELKNFIANNKDFFLETDNAILCIVIRKTIIDCGFTASNSDLTDMINGLIKCEPKLMPAIQKGINIYLRESLKSAKFS